MHNSKELKEIIVRMMALPPHVRVFTMLDAQGDYNVYINETMTYEQRLRSFAHEKRHIENGDFGSELRATEIERRSGGKT